MSSFIDALTDPNIYFLRYALIAGLLASFSFGIIGSFVVVKRISYIAGSISHCVLGGIGLALFLNRKLGITWITPMTGAIIAALFAAILMGLMTLHSKEREDSVIGSFWVIGMGMGLIFISKTPGYVDTMSYLFGNILMISKQDLWVIFILDIVIILFSIIFYNKLLSVCFDEEFARLRGIHTNFYYLLLLCLTALTIVLMVRIVGIVMVVALLTLPGAVASHFSGRLWQMMAISSLLCMFYISSGLAISYTPDLPPGAVIVSIAGFTYIALLLVKYLSSKFKITSKFLC